MDQPQEDAQLPSNICLYKLTIDAEQDWRRGISPDTQWQEHAGRRQFEFTLDPLTTPSSPAITGSAKKHLFSYIVLICIDISSYYNA